MIFFFFNSVPLCLLCGQLIVGWVCVNCVIQSSVEPKILFLALYFINCQVVQFLCVFLKLDDVRVSKLNGLFLYLPYSFIILLIDNGTLC